MHSNQQAAPTLPGALIRAAFILALCAGGFGVALSSSKGEVAGSHSVASQAATVRIDNFTFGPDTTTVAVGTTVTWVNGDDIPHTVVSEGNAFRSKALDTDDSFSFTFASAGEYPYFCSLHPHMRGKIVVKAGGG